MGIIKLMSALLALVAGGAVQADDGRQLVTLPAPAQAVLREEMLGNLLAINEIITHVAEGKLEEASRVAEEKLGVSAMGRHRALPLEARPGAHMPPAMHEIGISGHKAASEFARAAASGNRDQALSRLPGLTANCVACHYAYRLR